MNSTTKTTLGTKELAILDKHIYPVLLKAGYAPEVAAGIVQRIVRNWFLQDDGRDALALEELCKMGWLDSMFTWSETREGHVYWSCISAEILTVMTSGGGDE